MRKSGSVQGNKLFQVAMNGPMIDCLNTVQGSQAKSEGMLHIPRHSIITGWNVNIAETSPCMGRDFLTLYYTLSLLTDCSARLKPLSTHKLALLFLLGIKQESRQLLNGMQCLQRYEKDAPGLYSALSEPEYRVDMGRSSCS